MMMMNHQNQPSSLVWQPTTGSTDAEMSGSSPYGTAAAAGTKPPPTQHTTGLDTESILSGFKKAARANSNGFVLNNNHNSSSSSSTGPSSLSTPNHHQSPAHHQLHHSPSSHPQLIPSNAIPNPYHGNYQPPTNSGQVHSVVSMRSAGRHSVHSNGRNGQPPKTLESPYSLNHHLGRVPDQMQVQMPPVVAMASGGGHHSSPDDIYNDNNTAITGNTSDQSGSMDDLSKIDKSFAGDSRGNSFQMRCQMWSATVIATVLSVCAFLTPVIMVLLPNVEMFEWKTKECSAECDGLVISLVFKLLILAFGSWAVFFRRPKATLPRICAYRAAVLGLIVIMMVSYWLFYSVRIAEKRFNEEDAISYHSIILFAVSYVDALLFIHYLAVLLLEFRHHLDTRYYIKVVRSPDGHGRCYTVGRTSIQRASVWILEKYYQDFPRYNPLLDRIAVRKSRKNSGGTSRQGLKYYDVDASGGGGLVVAATAASVATDPNEIETNSALNSITVNPLQLSPKSILAQNTAANAGRPKRATHMNGGGTITDGRGGNRTAANRNHHHHHTDRDNASHHSGHSGRHHHHRHHSFHDEHDYERRIRKRKSRLIYATEEAFTHIKRVQQSRTGPSIPMDPKEAAQAIFPTIARTLQKYLRVTRQQSRFTIQSILEHLADCLAYDLSPKTFLERYLSNTVPVMDDTATVATEGSPIPIQTWSLISDTLVSRNIEPGTMFLLRQPNDSISLLVTIHRMPHLNLVEEVIDARDAKFIFKLNSETSV